MYLPLSGFFSPVLNYLFGFHVFGLGFLTTLLFVFVVGGALPLLPLLLLLPPPLPPPLLPLPPAGGVSMA